MNLHELIGFIDNYLDIGDIDDASPKGLQVEGGEEVTKIVSGVSACAELFKEAAARRANVVMVHHGMFWDTDPKIVRGSLKQRLKILLDNDISLLGYHLALDRHPEVGNNIQIVERLDLVEPEPFADYNGKTISFIAKTKDPVPVADFIEMIADRINPDLRHYSFGPDKINSVAILSGGAPRHVREAVDRGADLYLTGEDTESIYHLSKEEGIHYVAAGHHATERFGVIALGELLERKFDIEVEFVDVPNPI
jgi:dinuclear metal center YbgI/SA1388 family protein